MRGFNEIRSYANGHELASSVQNVESQCNKHANLPVKSSSALACRNRFAVLVVDDDDVDRTMQGFTWQDEQF